VYEWPSISAHPLALEIIILEITINVMCDYLGARLVDLLSVGQLTGGVVVVTNIDIANAELYVLSEMTKADLHSNCMRETQIKKVYVEITFNTVKLLEKFIQRQFVTNQKVPCYVMGQP